ncbi:MAG: hypothetical protein M1825_002745 [Sarcosagium campestre]|nr:MAG: hypothetical protein M1825_002745 [Sarcosagium campestre]
MAAIAQTAAAPIRNASASSASALASHGQHIYIYNNLRTNQVIYSLTEQMRNNKSLAQLPFLGKKTVPATLRRDLWLPLAKVSFPFPAQGLLAFQKLREYRKLHELSWSADDPRMRNPKQPEQLLGRKQRAKQLMDQKANSIADLAAVLKRQQDDAAVNEAIQREEEKKRGENPVQEDIKPPTRPPKLRRGGKPILPRFNITTIEGVEIRWTNILDAEFAESWPQPVVHHAGNLDKRGRRPQRRRESLSEDSVEIDEE